MAKYLTVLFACLSIAVVTFADELVPPQTQISNDLQNPENRHVQDLKQAVPIYRDVKHNGFWWYQAEPEKKNEPGNKQKPGYLMPSMKDYTSEQLWTMHPKDFQPLLDAFLDKAVQYPNEENVADYYRIQDIARAKANTFANVATLVWQKHPELSLGNENQTNNPSRVATVQMQNREVEEKIAESAGDYALLYFYKDDCGYCQVQNGINKYFVDKYGWQIRKLDVGRNYDLAAQFNATTVPFVVLIYKYSTGSIPVATGVTAVDEMEKKIYRGIRLLAGEVTPEGFNMYDFQRGGSFDPSQYNSGTRQEATYENR